jgi:hypothetical protein
MKSEQIVITLAEKDHFLGAAVLLNSLVQQGFNGLFLLGTKGDGGAARVQFEKSVQSAQKEDSFPDVEIFDVATTWHMTNIKGKVISDVFEKYPNAQTVAYFDPDIVVTCPWPFIVDWCAQGIALAGDVNWRMAADHPIRRKWATMLTTSGLKVARLPELYINGGFVGIHRDAADFGRLWHRLMEDFGASDNPLDASGDIHEWRESGRWQAMMAPDQDALNMAAMATPHAISTVGPDAMAFENGDVYFPHAVGANKPWRRKFLKDACSGVPPRRVDKRFWMAAGAPIQVFEPQQIRRKNLAIAIASLIGRCYHRQ